MNRHTERGGQENWARDLDALVKLREKLTQEIQSKNPFADDSSSSRQKVEKFGTVIQRWLALEEVIENAWGSLEKSAEEIRTKRSEREETKTAQKD